MATIIKRGKSYSVVHYEGEGKDRHQVWESGLSYSAAKTRKVQLEMEEANNTHIDQNNITVSEFLREFLQKYGEKKRVASTYDGNVGLLENYVYPYLGDKKLRSIRVKAVDDYYHFLLTEAEPAMNPGRPKREHISPSTIHDIHKVLRCAFNQAKRWELIAKNPFLDATLPEHKERKRGALTPEQLYKVLEFTDRPEFYDRFLIHCAIHLALSCTMRGGEVGGLQWDRVSIEHQAIYIDRVIDRVDKKLIEKLSKMDIIYTFPNLMMGTRTVIVLKQPKTEGSIRHTSASTKLVLSGGDLKAVQGDGGWNTPDMLTKCYAHILDENWRVIADKMETEFYGKNREKNEPQESQTAQVDTLLKLVQDNPDLLQQFLHFLKESVSPLQLANKP